MVLIDVHCIHQFFTIVRRFGILCLPYAMHVCVRLLLVYTPSVCDPVLVSCAFSGGGFLEVERAIGVPRFHRSIEMIDSMSVGGRWRGWCLGSASHTEYAETYMAQNVANHSVKKQNYGTKLVKPRLIEERSRVTYRYPNSPPLALD